MVTAVKGLPTQQQLLLCAATSLLGADGPPPGISTPSASFGQRRSSLGFNSPVSVRKQVPPFRLSLIFARGPQRMGARPHVVQSSECTLAVAAGIHGTESAGELS